MDAFTRTRLESWKEIAHYLKTSVRTVQRWEKDERLPVHRHGHARQDTVYAYTDEIDHWRSERDRRGTSDTSLSPEIASLQRDLMSLAPTLPGVSRSLQGPFVPRDEEHRMLQESLESVRAGGVRIVCVTGEPGAGKTTLLEHFISSISGIQNAPGQLVTFAACSHRFAGAGAFLPVLDSLDDLTRAGANAVITRLLKLTAPTWYVQIAPLRSIADPAFASVSERARAASPCDSARSTTSDTGCRGCPTPSRGCTAGCSTSKRRSV